MMKLETVNHLNLCNHLKNEEVHNINIGMRAIEYRKY